MYQKNWGIWGNLEEEGFIPHSPGNEKRLFPIPQGIEKVILIFPIPRGRKFSEELGTLNPLGRT